MQHRASTVRTLGLLGLLGIAALTAACTHSPAGSAPRAAARSPLPRGDAQSVRFVRAVRSFNSGIADSLRLAITTDSAWRALLVRLEGRRPPRMPDPDFARQTVIVATLGTRSAQSEWITIDSLRADGGSLTAFVRKPKYRAGCHVASSVSSPIDIVVADTAGLALAFVEHGQSIDCLHRELPQ